ncbi:hypothetical protein QBC47DRAFT_410891 [Echria macrotheca]|uniref:Mg2+ transporter n=1 Tax=Echria macrotheca TaxID=438768 RepID=A0AAJ0BH75_9PEZI|nr:hypothetical protein QBC47DRAFT_410891 [Echria macrotheca]
MQHDDDDGLLPPRRRETTPGRIMGPRQEKDVSWQRPAPPDARTGALPGPSQELYPSQRTPTYYYQPQPHPMHYPQLPTYYQAYGAPYSQPYPVQFISPPDVPLSSVTGSHVASTRVPHSRSRPAYDRERTPSPSPAPVIISRGFRSESDGPDRSDRYSDDESVDVRVRRGVKLRGRSPFRPPPPSPRVRFDDSPAPSSTVYSFTPSRLSSTQPGTLVDDESIAGKTEGDDTSGSARREPPDHAVRLLHVFQSQYKGDHTLGGSHGAELTAATNSRSRYQPVFRWQHCTRTFMDFDDFSKEAIRVPGLTTGDKKGIRDLLTRVRRKFVKTVQTADGRSVRHMEPACIQQVLPQDNSLKGSGPARRTLTWICLPYITLEKYSGLQGAAENPSAFPIETLLQAKFSRTGRERDMLQAVCQSKDTPGGLCYHVAQIWCLIVGNSILFTYSRMTEENLRGDSIDLVAESTTIEKSPDTRPAAVIAVCYRHTVLWSIPVDQCQTWLCFLVHFREFWPQRLQFFHRKRPVTADNWPKVWNLARNSDTKITLEMRIGPSLEPPPVGILVPKNVERDESADPVHASQSQSPPPTDNNKPGSSRRAESVPRKRGSTAPPVLSIFSCLPGVADSKYDSLDEDALEDYFLEVEDYILSRTTFSDRRAYTACPEASRDKIYDELERKGIELSGITDVQREQQRNYERQLDIFNAVDVLFTFFFPPDVVVPTTGKFWGALEAVINAVVDSPLLSRYSRYDLRSFCVQTQQFQEMFSQSGMQERCKITVPKEIVEGWIHLLMALVYLPKDDEKGERLLDDARVLITSGMATMIRALSDKSLLDSSVLLPQELVSLLSLKLLQDSTLGMPDATQCYSACLQELAADIQSKPSDRSREYRISLLLEEISIMQRIIGTQISIFELLMSLVQGADPGSVNQTSARLFADRRPWYIQTIPRDVGTRDTRDDPADDYDPNYLYPSISHPRATSRSYRDDPPTRVITTHRTRHYSQSPEYDSVNPDFKLQPTDPDGFRALLLNECLSFLAGRERDFAGFRSWASFLEKVNRNKIDTTKDRHDNAIYAFTIVTIVFLPLSAIASIFGMNTTDVRDMELGQWAYWAVALPVTALVIFLGLLWTGELGNMVGWVQSFGGGGPRRGRHGRGGGYAALPEIDGGGGDGRFHVDEAFDRYGRRRVSVLPSGMGYYP